ncbi:MAG TPA: heterodisulfide reductase-related iron-sulfur binding cluster, partial [Blastocatellia bacterium]|nr:heterodisulfide reductase-related iron-sulfur binding cluster [Blastocatellia bacterium]
MANVLTGMDEGTSLAAELEANSDKLLTCVHCGLCLPACPTYRILGNENDSPRGRIYLMRAVTEGRLSVGGSFISHIDRCLGCRACESVCPSGVPYGHLFEAARVEVKNARSDKGEATATLLRFLLNHIFTRPLLLRAGFAIARLVRDSGLARMAYESNAFGARINLALALLIATRRRTRRGNIRRSGGEKGPSSKRMNVAVLRGCVMEGLFEETNRATERALAHAGCDVVEADGQTCCGALHSHAGEIERARELARKNIEAFSESGCELVIVNSAGCGAAMKEYAALLAGDTKFAARAKEFSQKVRDVSEVLAEVGVKGLARPTLRRVAYDAPCHLLHAQKVAA